MNSGHSARKQAGAVMHAARVAETSIRSSMALRTWGLWMKLVVMMSCIDLRPRCEVPSGKADMLCTHGPDGEFRAMPKEA